MLKLATKTAHANTFCSCRFRMLLSFLDSGQARLGSYIAQIDTPVGRDNLGLKLLRPLQTGMLLLQSGRCGCYEDSLFFNLCNKDKL